MAAHQKSVPTCGVRQPAVARQQHRHHYQVYIVFISISTYLFDAIIRYHAQLVFILTKLPSDVSARVFQLLLQRQPTPSIRSVFNSSITLHLRTQYPFLCQAYNMNVVAFCTISLPSTPSSQTWSHDPMQQGSNKH